MLFLSSPSYIRIQDNLYPGEVVHQGSSILCKGYVLS